MNNKTKIIISGITLIFSLLLITKNASVDFPNPRALNVSQEIITRTSSGGDGYNCFDKLTIVDKELAHGEQINAYLGTDCKTSK